MQALAPAGDTTAQERPKQPVRFETLSARATLTEPDAPSVHASLRTANATLGPLTSPRYFVRSKESWRQLAEHVRHHKSPESSFQHNNDSISSNLLTATQWSTEKRERESPRQHEFEKDKGGDKIGGGEAHPRLSKCAKRCKGE